MIKYIPIWMLITATGAIYTCITVVDMCCDAAFRMAGL